MERTQKLTKIQNIQEFLILAILSCLPFYFIKFRYDWVSLNIIEIFILALFLVWIIDAKEISKLPITNYQLPVFLIVAGLLLSVIVNKNYYAGLGVMKGWFIFPILFAIIFYNNLERDKNLLAWSLSAIFWGGTLVSIGGIYYWISGFLTYDGRLAIFYDSPNQLAMYLAPILLIGIYKVQSWGIPEKFDLEESRTFLKMRKGKTKPWKTGAIILGILLIIFNLYLTKSFGAWIAIGLALVIFFWLEYKKTNVKKPFFIIIIIFIILLGIAGLGKLENIKNLGDRSSLASRLIIWKSARLMVKNNPLFGIGPRNFQAKYLEYQNYFPPYLEWAVPQPHNLFLAWWLEAGLVGLVGFLWVIWLFFKDNKKAIANNHSLGIMCLAVMLYFLLHGLIDTTYWRNDMAVIFWIIIAVNLYIRSKYSKKTIY